MVAETLLDVNFEAIGRSWKCLCIEPKEARPDSNEKKWSQKAPSRKSAARGKTT